MIRKRLLSACLALALCLSLLPVTALAAGEHDSHSNGWTEFTAGITTLSGGSYYLSGDVEYTGTESITVSGEVILCLNDHKLDLKGQHISVGSGASLTLCDCSTGGVLTGGSGSNGGGVYVGGGGTFTMTGGSIAGNTANAGGGVYVDEGGTFTMEDGSINNNQATSGGGGGVMVNKGSFTLSGGSITGNTTNDDTFGYGGGVCLYGTFYLSGDSIIQNNTKAGATDNLYLGWNTIKITGPLGENARIGVTAEGVPRSFISGWSDNMAGENPADYFSSDSDALGIGLNTAGEAVLGSPCTTITLHPNGGTLPEYSLVAGAALPIPTKTGYTFAGWYENPDFTGNPVADVPTDSTGELTFYAKWTANTYTVIFDANGGSVDPTSAVTVAGKLTSLPIPTYDGYNFLGWYTQKDGGEKVTTDTVFAMDSTIYAHWSNIPVTSLELNKGTLTLQEKDSDTLTVTVKPADATNQDVTWESSNTSIATVSADGTVTAISAGTATITAIAADGSGQKATCTVTVTALPEPEPEPEPTPPPYIPPSKPNWTSVARKLANAQPGDTVTVKMNGETEVPGEVWETIAGRDVTVILDMGGNVSWTVDGNDVPTATHFADMDFGVDRNTTGIDVDVINAITGQVSSVQITLAHDGEFGFTLTLTAPLGRENAGYWANLYHYDEDAKTLNYETSAQVASDGTASLRMTHASQYAIIIDDQAHQLPFEDVTSGTWYEGAVRYAYLHDIMEGMSATTFQPNGTLSRAMAVQIFYNLEGQPDISDENLGYPYEDVNAQAWYGDAVYWARITGVATGYGDGTFQPTDSITRQEFAQMLYNYAKYKDYDLTAEGDLSTFPDGNKVQEWAVPAMSWANGNQLINGHDDGTLEPGGTATRAQAASILTRFDQNFTSK